jgi:hypothetical protein
MGFTVQLQQHFEYKCDKEMAKRYDDLKFNIYPKISEGETTGCGAGLLN